MEKLFGTDGIRGVVGELITPQFALRLAKSIACFLKKQSGKKNVLICHDTRTSAEELEKALCEGLTEFGVDVVLGGVMPTPAVHFLAQQHDFCLALMITASHNTGEYNGFKLITNKGLKFDDEKEDEITQIFWENNFENKGEEKGKVTLNHNLVFEWTDFLQKSVNANFSGKKIALDCANGASFFVAPFVFEKMGAKVVAICNKNDGKNINNNCGSTHLEKIVQTVKQNDCDLGFAFDGDADRVNVVLKGGTVLGGEELLFCCFKFLKENNMLKTNEIITPIVTNGGLDKTLGKMGFEVLRCGVGGKNIQKLMLEKGASFGAENNGHIVWGDFNKCSCGLLTALFLTKFSQTHNLKDVCLELELFVQLNQTFQADNLLKQKLDTPFSKQKFLEAENLLKQDNEFSKVSRFIVRPSGTEPIIRLVVEGEDEEKQTKMMEILKDILKSL